jgi:hypothetical protein
LAVRLPVSPHVFQRWFIRATLALALVTPAILWILANGLNADRSYTIEIDFNSSVDGTLQVFYDRSNGSSPLESAAIPVRAGAAPESRRLPIPGGTYRGIRIDPPGTTGRFTIAGVRLRDWGNAVVTEVPLSSLKLAWQLALISQGPPLVVESPPGANDPQINWNPAQPLVLKRDPRSTPLVVAKIAGMFGASFLLVITIGRVLAPLEPRVTRWLAGLAGRCARRPAAAIAAAALVGTLGAMYPIAFLGKSLVSPNNNSAVLLYDRPPFTPDQHDRSTEELRGVDVGAAMWQFVPYSQIQRISITQGELPLWDRYNAAGRPLWGQGQSLILDPLHWVTLIAPDPGLGWDLKFLLHRFVFGVGVGVAVLAITQSWVAAAVMALLAPFAGYFLFRLNHSAQFSFTYAPWVMWAWFQIAAAVSRRDLTKAGRWLAVFTMLLFVASPPKEAVIMLLCCYLTGTLACLTPIKYFGRRLQTAFLAFLWAMLLATPHWLIFVRTLSQSLTAYDAPAARFATWPFAISLVFGLMKPGGLLPAANPPIAAFGLAALLVAWGTWRSGAKRAAVLGPAITLAIAFGAVPESVIIRLPFFANIHQIDFTFMGATIVLMCIAGGIGVAGLLEMTAGDEHRFRRAVLPTVGCAAVGALLMWKADVFALHLFVESWVLLFAAVLATLLVPVVRIAATTWPSPAPILTAVVISLLLVVPNIVHATSGVVPLDDILVQPRGRTRLATSSPAVNAIRADAKGPTRVVGLHEVLFPGSQSLYGLESLGGPDALELPRYEELINKYGVTRFWDWGVSIDGTDLNRLARLLDLLNVGYVLAGHGAEDQRLPPGAESLTPLHMDGDDLVLAARRSGAWPRAFFVDRVAHHRGVNEFVTQLRESNGPFASVDASDDVGSGFSPISNPDDVGSGSSRIAYEAATNYKLTANRTSFRVRASGPGVAVLTEAWMANDFVATLNGVPVPYFRVNHAFKGVRIPAAGDWAVEFRYRPALWGISWIVAVLGMVGIFFFPLILRADA